MSTKFTRDELCLLADLLTKEVYAVIDYSCPIFYKNAANTLCGPTDYMGFARKWEVDRFALARKLSAMDFAESQRLTYALIHYWEPFHKHGIELNLEEWAENELWNW